MFNIHYWTKYLTKIIKCDEQFIVKNIGCIDIFKEKILKGEIFDNNMLYMKEVKMELKFMFGSVPTKKNKFGEYMCEEKPIDIFFGIDEGRVYLEEGRFNTKDEGKK